MSYDIVKNEPTAAKRVASPILVRTPDGLPESGLTFDHTVAVVGAAYGIAWEVEIWNGAAYIQASANAVEDAATGDYTYQFSQAEVNTGMVVGGRAKVRVFKATWTAAGRPPVEYYAPIVATDLETIAADAAAGLAAVEAAIASIGVTVARIKKLNFNYCG